MKLTLGYLRKHVENESDAYLLMEQLRWGKDNDRLVCPDCGHNRAYFLNPKGGARGTGLPKADGKRTQSVRRVWKCAKCRKQFSVLTGTILHGTKVALADWLTVMVLMCSAKNGISAREVERLIDVTPETAWFMLHRLRESMKRDPLAGLLRGIITADETFIGGKNKNQHRQGIRRFPVGPASGGGQGGGPGHMQPVLSLVNRTTGEVRSVPIPDVTGATLAKAIAEQVDMAGSTLHTDAHLGYRRLGPQLESHEWVDHSSSEYVRGAVTTNHAEGYFSQLKRSIDGTHHHVSREHLPRYLAEFDFRYTTRP